MQEPLAGSSQNSLAEWHAKLSSCSYCCASCLYIASMLDGRATSQSPGGQEQQLMRNPSCLGNQMLSPVTAAEGGCVQGHGRCQTNQHKTIVGGKPREYWRLPQYVNFGPTNPWCCLYIRTRADKLPPASCCSIHKCCMLEGSLATWQETAPLVHIV